MKIEDIELHVGEVDFRYRPVRELKAKCEASHAFMPAPTEMEVNAKLRGMAAKVGANAVVNVQYNSGVSLTSWKSISGTGLAVIRESDTVTCPNCAETIKRAAVKCRFCGELIDAPEEGAKVELLQRAPQPQEAEQNHSNLPPLEETNNPIWWMIAAGIALFFMLMLIGL